MYPEVRKHVNDLYEDLRDGHNLISLLEVLSGDTLPRERDILKTLRLVSSTEACPYEQHEDEEDEDKGVGADPHNSTNLVFEEW
uniref:Uncharacterized protein n=1 Tax=Sphaerodactylus townsendi TaxID=933632 RepID=A0ACB8GCX7_9SAUR